MLRFRPRARSVRVPMLLALLVVAGALAPLQSAHGQAPDSVVSAATADLGVRLSIAPVDIAVLRVESVIWNDGCIGAAEQNEACTEALVPGFALWLSDGDVAYRYHSDETGRVLRLGESMIPLSQVPVAPLPQGATPGSALERFLDHLAGAGFDEILVQELAALRDWIPGSFSPHYIVGDATLEIFEVASLGEVDAAIARLRQFGGDADLGEDQALWRYETLIVILLRASERPAVLDVVSGLIGPPTVETTLDSPRPRPDPAALDTTVAAVLDALKRERIEAALSDVAVHRPFLPTDALSAVLSAEGVSIEVFALLDPGAVTAALEDALAEPALSAGFVIWTRGSTLVLVEGSGRAQAPLIDAISAVLGAPAFLGEGVTGPTPDPVVEPDAPPEALPATGNGGLDDEEPPAWVWGAIVAVAMGMVALGGVYRLWLRRRAP